MPSTKTSSSTAGSAPTPSSRMCLWPNGLRISIGTMRPRESRRPKEVGLSKTESVPTADRPIDVVPETREDANYQLPSQRGNPSYGIYDVDDEATVLYLKSRRTFKASYTKSYHVEAVLSEVDASAYFAKHRKEWVGTLEGYVDAVWNQYATHRDRLLLERHLLSCGYIALSPKSDIEDVRHCITELDAIEYRMVDTIMQVDAYHMSIAKISAVAPALSTKFRDEQAEYRKAKSRLLRCLQVTGSNVFAVPRTSTEADSCIYTMPERRAVFEILTHVMRVLDEPQLPMKYAKHEMFRLEAELRTVTRICESRPVIVDTELIDLCAEVLRRTKWRHPTINP